MYFPKHDMASAGNVAELLIAKVTRLLKQANSRIPSFSFPQKLLDA
jgi:hypothetical protein